MRYKCMKNELYKVVQKKCIRQLNLAEVESLMDMRNADVVYVLGDTTCQKREYKLELLTEDKVYLNAYEPQKKYRGKHTTTYSLSLFTEQLRSVYFI